MVMDVPASARKRRWQHELGTLKKTSDTWDAVAQAFVTASCSQVWATGPHLYLGCQSMNLVARARVQFASRVCLATPPFTQSVGNFGMFIGGTRQWHEKARQAMMCEWWNLGLLLPSSAVDSVVGAAHEFRTQSLADWGYCWCVTDQKFWLSDVPGHVHDSLQVLVDAVLCHVNGVCVEERQLRKQSEVRGVHGHEVCAAWQDVNTDEVQRRQLLDAAAKVFHARPSTTSWEPAEDSTFYQQFQQLVPWKIERLQCVKSPKVRRGPLNMPWTHRGACLQYVSGHVVVETEELSSQVVLRARFGAPVQLAIFWYGFAMELLPISSEDPEQRVRDVPSGIVQIAEGVRFILGESAARIPRSTCQLVGKLHLQLGHLSKRELTRLLSSHGASSITLEAVTKLECDTCTRAKSVPPSRAASAPTQPAPCFGDHSQCDFFHCVDLAGVSHTILGVIDSASHLHVARRVHEKAAEPTLHALLSSWITPFGVPVEIKADLDPAFRGKCTEGLAILGVEVLHVPAEQHSQLGRIERHNAVLRTALLKLIDDQGVARGEELDIVLAAATHAKNHLMRKAGVSPFVAAFGRLPRIPGELFADGDQFAGIALTENEQIRRAMHLRLAAQKVMLDVQQLEALRAAILRKSLPGHDVNFQPGQRVAFFRTRALQRQGARVKRSGYIPATFIAYESGPRKSNNAWVLAGSRVTLVSCSQLRPAIGFEQWVPDATDQVRLEEAIRNGSVEQLPQEIESPPAPEFEPLNEMDVGSMFDHQPVADVDSRFDQMRAGMRTPVYPTLDFSELPEAVEDEDVVEPLGESLRVQEREEDVEEERKSKTARTARTEEDVESTHGATAGSAASSVHAVCLWEYVDVEQTAIAFLPPDGWDGSEVLMSSKAGRYVQHEASFLDSSDDHAAADDLSRSGWASQQSATDAASLKALQKELPWQFIMQQPREFVEAFHEALRKEESSWKKWGPVREMTESETRQVVKSCPRRIMKSRAVYRDKHCGVPPLAAKARVVVLGFNDPDLSTIARYSPVISRVGVAFVLQVFASSHCGSQRGWLLITADIATAFLQGTQQRTEPLYMWSPRDPLVAGSATFKPRMFEIQGNVYGLCNAPHTFSRKVIAQMSRAGFCQHPLDCMLFLYYSEGVLQAVAGFHVDDPLLACSRSFPMHLIREAFEWGSWSECSVEDATEQSPASLTFTGKQILVRHDGSVCVCMSSYIDTLPQCEIPSARNRSDTTLQPGKEMQLYRSAIGSLQWMAGSARPDLAAWCSLLQQPSPDVSNLRQVAECLEFARKTKDRGSSFYPVDLRSCLLVLYADASFGNAAKSGSQCGMIIALTSSDCLKSAESFPASIIEYKSFRARRVCRSTLAAEAQAIEAGVDHTQFVASYFTMGLTGISLREAQNLPSIPFC
eukprot:6471125-Amphidinium_carterae.1